jgi:putative endonuclease
MKKEYKFYVYILSNHNRTVYYTGITNSLIRRLIEHKNGFGSVFTKKYKLNDLVYYEEYKYSYEAINREKEIKGWTRQKKLDLIRTMNREFIDLGKRIFSDCGINDDEIKGMVKEINLKRN